MLIGVLCIPLTLGMGVFLILNPHVQGTSSRSRAIMGHGPLTQLFGVLSLAVAAVLVYTVLLMLLSRVVADRSGIHVRRVTARRDLAWPPSRSAFLTEVTVSKGVVSSNLYLIAPDGTPVVLPGQGLTGSGRAEDRAATETLRVADTLWAWAEVRGLVRESGQYVRSTSRLVERNRLSPAREHELRAAHVRGPRA